MPGQRAFLGHALIEQSLDEPLGVLAASRRLDLVEVRGRENELVRREEFLTRDLQTLPQLDHVFLVLGRIGGIRHSGDHSVELHDWKRLHAARTLDRLGLARCPFAHRPQLFQQGQCVGILGGRIGGRDLFDIRSIANFW